MKDPGVDKYFFQQDTKHTNVKEITDRQIFIKLKNFCLSKDTIKRIEARQSEKRYLQHKYLTKDYQNMYKIPRDQ